MIPNWVSGNLNTYSLQIRRSSHKKSIRRKDQLPSICESQCLRFVANTTPTACVYTSLFYLFRGYNNAFLTMRQTLGNLNKAEPLDSSEKNTVMLVSLPATVCSWFLFGKSFVESCAKPASVATDKF